MRKLKILLHDYAGHPFQTELSRELAARGHTVIHAFFAGDAGPKGNLRRSDTDPATLSFAGVDVAGGYSKQSLVRRRFQDIAYGKAAAELVARERPDIVISGNTPTEAQDKIMAATRQVNGRFVYWCQDFYSIAVSKILPRKLPVVGHAVAAWYTALERRQMRQSDGVVLITADFKQQALSWGVAPERIHVVPNWGAINEIPVLPKANDWSREHDLTDKLVFLYSGTLGLKHNPGLLSALGEHFRSNPRVRIVVNAAGTGADALAEEVAAKKLDNVLLLGLQPFNRFAEVLASADAFLAVIERDAGVFSVPSKVLSYFCAARPILLAAPSENLAARNVREAGAGFTVEPDDVDGWIRAAQSLADEEALRRSMGAAGRSHAEANFEITTVADRFEAVFASARGDAGSGESRSPNGGRPMTGPVSTAGA